MDVMSSIASFPLDQAIKKQENQGRLAAATVPPARCAGVRLARRCGASVPAASFSVLSETAVKQFPGASTEESRHRVREGSEVQGQNVLPL